MKNYDIAAKIAADLLSIKAVELNIVKPFIWSSGWKSPIYCDNRKILSYPILRTYIKNCFVSCIQENFPQTDMIIGVATAGIPIGVLVADLLELPFLYVRSKPKKHGLVNSIEGNIVTGKKAIVIEDLISTGSSALNACAVLQEKKIEILGVVAIFEYGFFVALENFKKVNIPCLSLSNYDILINKAVENGNIDESALELLRLWKNNPSDWKR